MTNDATTAARFADVLGHARAISILKRSLAAERLHHAYLFSGPDGVGKRRTAWALAAAVNCLERGADGDGCGRCVSCHKVVERTHPDVVQVEPDGRQIKIDQIRDIHARSRFRPHEGVRRVVIIDRADTMREEASNALLKNLEEPRGETMFVLVTSSPQRLLTTIRSRCQPVRFGRLQIAALEAIVRAARPDAAADALAVAVRLADGSAGGALDALDGELLATRAEVAERLAALPTAPLSTLLAWADTLSRPGAPARETLASARTLLRDAALMAAGASEDRLVNVDQRDAVRAMAAHGTPATLVASLQRVAEAESMLDGNVQARMALESLWLTLRDAPTRPLARQLA